MTTPDDPTAAGTTPAAPAAPTDKTGLSRAWLYAAALETLANEVKKYAAALLKQERPDGSPVMAEGDRETAFLSGRRLGAATMCTGKTTAKLEPDHPALVAWAENHPRYAHNVITRKMLAPAVVDQLKKHAANKGAPVDEHGEIIPGMTIVHGEPYLRKTLDETLVDELLNPTQIARIVDNVIQGTLTLPGLLAIDAPKDQP